MEPPWWVAPDEPYEADFVHFVFYATDDCFNEGTGRLNKNTELYIEDYWPWRNGYRPRENTIV